MKKYISIILSILCILSLAGCGKKEKVVPDTPNAMVPSIIYEGNLYRTTGKQIPAEVDESAIVGEICSVVPLTQLPIKEGEANFGEIGDQYAITSDGLLVTMNNEWTLFEVSETELSDGAPLAPDVSDKDLESVSYIEVMSGLTGQRIKVKDTDSVQKVMDDIESLKYKKKNAVEEVGYAYRIRFYNENDDELGRIFITEENGHQISYDGYYYLVEADLNINVDFLEELLKDAPPAEPGDEGNDELPDKEAFSVTNVFVNESKSLLANDGATIEGILEKGSWNTEGTTDCLSNIEIEIKGTIYKYHSECGTFNDKVNQRYLSLDDITKEKINSIISEYISLVTEEAPIE